jgi:hypothetical protein
MTPTPIGHPVVHSFSQSRDWSTAHEFLAVTLSIPEVPLIQMEMRRPEGVNARVVLRLMLSVRPSGL